LDPNIWKNKSEAEKLIKEKKYYENLINSYSSSVKECSDLVELYNLAIEDNNNLIVDETLLNIKNLYKKTRQNEIKCFLSKETDVLNAYLEIHAGAGGTESQDWAEMLRRMYMKWSFNKSFKCHLISEHKGDEAE